MTAIEPSLNSLNKLSKIAADLLGDMHVHTIFEFGSRYGEDSIAFANRYPGATIYAFECNPNTLPECRKNVDRYKNIILTEKAVAATDGTLSFFKIDQEKTQTTWADGNQGASSILKASGKYPVEQYVQEEVTVNSTKLSTFMTQNDLQEIDILWMDIQGAELLALKGLEEKISKVKIIHMEVEFFEIYKDQPLFDEIAHFLSNAGFYLIGFTSQGVYAGDGIFVNSGLLTPKNIKRYKKWLKPYAPNVFKRSYILTKRILIGVIRRLRRLTGAAFA